MNILNALAEEILGYKYVLVLVLVVTAFYVSLVVLFTIVEISNEMSYVKSCQVSGGVTLTLSDERLCMDSEVFEGIFIELGEDK